MARTAYIAKTKGFFDGVRRRPGDKVITEAPLDPVPKWLEPVKEAPAKGEVDASEKAKTKAKQGGKKGPAVAEGNEGSPGLPEKKGSVSDAEVI